MSLIPTTHGDLDEVFLRRREDVVDNAHEHTVAVEYCLSGCQGEAHRSGQATGTGCFCERHVHRSVHVTLKEWPAGMTGVLGDLGKG